MRGNKDIREEEEKQREKRRGKRNSRVGIGDLLDHEPQQI
jgi:hypothetical protein